MTATLLPGNPEFPSAAEETVCRALAEQLPDDATILVGQRIMHEGFEAEIDLLVMWPGVGMAAIEVKGGVVEIKSGKWLQSGRNLAVSPIEQVRRAKHALIGYLKPQTSFQLPRIGHFVAVPYTNLPPSWSVPEAPRGIMIDGNDLPSAARIIQDGLMELNSYVAPQREHLEHLCKALRATHRAIVNTQLLAQAIEDKGNKLTREQERILALLRFQPRAQLVGGAGSGKTHLALMKARQLAADGQRVALVCYSRGLARHFELMTMQWPENERPQYVGLFHELGRHFANSGNWDAKMPDGVESDQFYSELLPKQLQSLSTAASPEDKFDAILVDEAQDFENLWWDAVTECLELGEEGILYAFADSRQTVFDRHGAAPIELNPFPLDDNLRNSNAIACCFAPLTESPQRVRGDDGEPVVWVPVDVSGDRDDVSAAVIDAADEEVEKLMDANWEPGDIALLTTGRRHPEHYAQMSRDGHDVYWDSYFSADDVFYGHVLGFKGLEKRAVVLALNSFQNLERARQLLYVGLSRARSKLVVVGTPELLRQAGGDEVFRLITRSR
ncbi:DEAD/DEAH box helicase [Neomicrococcus aestuarii]|uniref:Uncharacterized protein n=1 Tax=Neomicrococcus aestuarii TaxID=556325 RepID=A0A1L2ZQ96_9MICC|nr:NERD domain-containing protein [Neomicrococcus aestuarii]APF41208.1 hypothetical protein BHE16_09645 [Neomicrococcus aestuarii]